MDAFQLEFIDARWWMDWFLGENPGMPDRPHFDFYVIADTAFRVGRATEVVRVSQPAGAIRLAESLWRNFASTKRSRLLACDAAVLLGDDPAAPELDYIMVSTGVVAEQERGFDVRHLPDGLVELRSLSGASAVVGLEDYRREVGRYIETLRGFYASPYKDPGSDGRTVLRHVWGCIDSILEDGRPPAGFQDFDFGWYAPPAKPTRPGRTGASSCRSHC